WMVLDYKLYTPGQKGDALPDNLLWVAEQIPGNVTSADVTQTLRDTSYWASYNIPYFPNIYNLSGFAELEQEYGPVFSYTKYSRPEIFKRNNTDVVDLESMRRMMRYNNWQEDPLSLIPLCPECNPRGSPWLAIASRGDLVGSNEILPSNNGYASQFARQSMGAIDSKIASYAMMQNGGGMGNVINGPTTYDGQPIFIFDEAFPGQRPPGCANVFNYSWVFFNVVGGGKPPIPAATTSDDPASRNVILGVCIAVPIALVIAALALAKHRKRMAAMDEYSPLTQ
ncbi:lysosomal endosomal membrane protein p67, putative, partial [Bodo saltans]